jgi:IPT/TIG domain
MTPRLALVLATLLAGSAVAGNKVIKNDNFTGAGGIGSGVSFGEYEGAGVLFQPDPSEYPLKIVGIDVLLVPYMQQGSGVGAYEVEIYDEGAPVGPPRMNDAGTYDQFALRTSRLGRQGVQFSTSTSMFNRFALSTPVIVDAGAVFVQVTEQTQTSLDGTTIAVDTSAPKPFANWYFDGFGSFHVFDLADGGTYNNINHNWIIRLVLEVADTAVTVTAINPNTSVTTASPSVVISGTNFELGATALLGTNALAITNLTGTSVRATVPAGLTPGVYDVIVRNPNGVEGKLMRGYTVFDTDGGMGTGGGAGGGTGGGAGGGGGSTGNEVLALTAITPTQTYAADATSLFLTGAGFKAGAQVLIGGTRVEGPVVESSGVISAALVANLLTPGTYDVSVINLSGEKATLPQSFKVLAGSFAAPKLLGLALIRRRRR